MTTTSTLTATTITTVTTATLTTAATTTLFPAGSKCNEDSGCSSGACKTHCCTSSSPAKSCSACSNEAGGGKCYAGLGLESRWNPDDAIAEGWRDNYNKGEFANLAGPPSSFKSDMIVNLKGSQNGVRYRLLWGGANDKNGGDYVGASPPPGLFPSGEGADPGLFDVDATTGKVTAIPRKNGEFKVYLIVEDGAGSAADNGLPSRLDQAVVKQWSFTVTGKPDFVVDSYSRKKKGLDDVNIGDAPYIVRTTVGAIECVEGRTYHIAPIVRKTLEYKHASGGEDANIKFTIRNPPPGFFIDPETGEMQGTPKPISEDGVFIYTTVLLAVDPAGAQAELEEFEITIAPRPQFIPVFEAERTVSADRNDRYTDPSAAAQAETPFRVGNSYRIARRKLNREATTVSAGTARDITFTLSADAIDSFFVQAKTGDVFGTFPNAGTYSFKVLAVDQAGATAEVEEYTFNVEDRLKFEIAVGKDRVRTGDGYTDPASSSSTMFIVGETYRQERLLFNSFFFFWGGVQRYT